MSLYVSLGFLLYVHVVFMFFVIDRQKFLDMLSRI